MTVELMSPGEVAKTLKVVPVTVTRWAEAGKLTCIRTPGGHRRFFAAEVMAIMRGEPLTQMQIRELRLQVEAEAGERS